ncbi:MAG TPA: hemerythrin domain-containing protein [Burkholderiales bacterium]|nr:hemerythrin domain-containing protein [Burkholderiales bacterium]
MAAIGEFMTSMHRDCDRHLAEAECAVSRDDWDACAAHFALFCGAMEKHFDAEETILFPAFEEETGGEIGATRVMSMEHLRMRDMMRDLAAALELRDAGGYLELSDTFSILLQQHNIKEEHVLYPMMEETLSGRGEALQAEIEDLREES